jgi:phage terminase small subunit
MTDKKLTAKQERFVAEYLIDLNATQAAIRSGYSPKTAEVQGSRLLSNAKVAEAVAAAQQKRGTETNITAARVLQEIARLAFFDPRKLLTSDGEPVPIQELDDDTAAAIAGLETATEKERGGEGVTFIRKYKIADKNSALEKLSKHLGLYKLDNSQKTDALTEVLNRLSGSVLPVSKDVDA